MSDQFQKGTVLVTGGNRGIGHAICMELAGFGYDISFTYNSRVEEARNVSQELKGIGWMNLCQIRINEFSETLHYPFPVVKEIVSLEHQGKSIQSHFSATK